MPATKVAELRAMLAERFPGMRTRLGESRPPETRLRPTGVPQIDQPLRGGFTKGSLNEVIVPSSDCGGATLLRTLIEQAAQARQIVALIDGTDSFDASTIEEAVLARLLWIRCQTAGDAIRSMDLVLRDGNLPLVLVDLKAAPESQLRKISASTWYRFQRLIEATAAVAIIFTPRRLAAAAQVRVTLRPQFSLASLDLDKASLARQLAMDVAEAGKYAEMEFSGLQA